MRGMMVQIGVASRVLLLPFKLDQGYVGFKCYTQSYPATRGTGPQHRRCFLVCHLQRTRRVGARWRHQLGDSQKGLAQLNWSVLLLFSAQVPVYNITRLFHSLPLCLWIPCSLCRPWLVVLPMYNLPCRPLALPLSLLCKTVWASTWFPHARFRKGNQALSVALLGLTMARIQQMVWYGTSSERTSLFNFTLLTWPRFPSSCTYLLLPLLSLRPDWHQSHSLSWVDTAASTIGRLYGPSSPRLPPCLYIPHRRFPLVKIPLSPRKSVAGFLAASLTGMMAAVGFWGWIAPVRLGGTELSWDFVRGVTVNSAREGAGLRGWTGLGVIGVVSGLVSGITEALGMCCGSLSFYFCWWSF